MSQDPEIGHTVVAAGISTNYLEAGSGEPLVLLHGSGPGVTAWANWRVVMPVFAAQRRVLAPDLLGFGYTERPADGRYDLDRWVDHLVAFLDAVGVERADFVGNSFGGALTLALAARHPDRARRLVLMGSVGARFPITAGLDRVWGYEPSLENMQRTMETFVYDRSRLTDTLVRSRYEASVRPGYQESFSRLFPAPRQRHVDALALPSEQLRAIPHDVLLVHGREDQVIPLESSLVLHAELTRSELHVFGRCGHWTQIEQAEAFVRVVGEFLSRP